MKRAVLLLIALAGCHSHEPGLVATWQWQAPAPAYAGMPATSGERIAATYGHSYLAFFDRGALRWQTRLVGLRDVAPTFYRDEVLAATDSGVAAFATGDGAPRWQREVGDRASTPVVVGDRVVVTVWEGRVMMLDGWSVELPGPSIGPPAARRGIVVASWDAGVVGIDSSTGRVRWRRDFDGADTSAPAVIGSTVVVVGGDRRAHGLDLRTGIERWSIAMKGAGSPEVPPGVAGVRVAVVDRLGHLVVADADGRTLWSTDSRGAVVRGGPVWVGDAVAVPLDHGRVMVATRNDIRFRDPPGRVSGVAAWGKSVVMATREARVNGLSALRVR
jgi:outer membrane protein assembly factor BamB